MLDGARKRVVFGIAAGFLVFVGFAIAGSSTDAVAATVKPAQVTISPLERTSKSTVVVRWDKAYRAKGYQVYMKTNSGSFKRIATTGKKKYKKTGLSIGSSYCFKVRAYRKAKGKTVYGKFSATKKIVMREYQYLVETLDPYASNSYTKYVGAQAMNMAGNKYFHSFSLANYSGYAIFNLNGSYSKITFYLGDMEGIDHDLVISCDDVVRDELTVKANALPKQYSLNVKDVYKLDFQHGTGYGEKLGFGNVKAYY